MLIYSNNFMSGMKLDRIDLEIIKLLMENSRISVTDIANRLEISRPTVRERMKKLVQNGVIKKFTVTLDDSIFRGIIVLFQFRPRELNKLINKLRNKDEIIQLYLTSGSDALFGIGVYESIDKLKRDIFNFIEEGEGFSFHIVVKKIKDSDFIPLLAFELYCDYCGKEIKENPIEFTLYNRNFYFCCKTCLSNFRKGRE